PWRNSFGSAAAALARICRRGRAAVALNANPMAGGFRSTERTRKCLNFRLGSVAPNGGPDAPKLLDYGYLAARGGSWQRRGECRSRRYDDEVRSDARRPADRQQHDPAPP